MANPGVDSLDGKSLFLEGLQPVQIETILAAAKPLHFRERSVITRQGSQANQFFLLAKGRARYFLNTPDGRKVLLMWISPGEVFGGAAFSGRPWHYMISTEAVRDCTVYAWDRPAIRNLARRFPQLFENALLIASEYFLWYVDTHVTLISRSAPQRLAHVLFHLSHSLGRRVNGGVELEVTNEDLASSANITPFTASRLLGRWQKSGLLRKRRGRVLVHSPGQLLDHALSVSSV